MDIGTVLDTYLQERTPQGFSGVVLLAKDREILLRKGYGLANRETEQPVTVDTIFCLGSVTKSFTGTAITKLASQGKIRTEDPINHYFSNVPADKAAITLHHLLTHTAGLEDIFGDDYELVSKEWVIEQALQSELLSPPGTQYAYSNAGYSLLGAIIEQVSDQSYEEYLNDHLFRPAGMTQTGYILPEWGRAKLACGYENDQVWGTMLDHPWAADGPSWNLRANGGLLSTIDDMFAWYLALQDEEILPDTAKKQMFAPSALIKAGVAHYSHGWIIVNKNDGKPYIGNTGGNGIFSAAYRHWTRPDIFLMVMTNTAEHRAGEYAYDIAELIFSPAL